MSAAGAPENTIAMRLPVSSIFPDAEVIAIAPASPPPSNEEDVFVNMSASIVISPDPEAILTAPPSPLSPKLSESVPISPMSEILPASEESVTVPPFPALTCDRKFPVTSRSPALEEIVISPPSAPSSTGKNEKKSTGELASIDPSATLAPDIVTLCPCVTNVSCKSSITTLPNPSLSASAAKKICPAPLRKLISLSRLLPIRISPVA